MCNKLYLNVHLVVLVYVKICMCAYLYLYVHNFVFVCAHIYVCKNCICMCTYLYLYCTGRSDVFPSLPNSCSEFAVDSCQLRELQRQVKLVENFDMMFQALEPLEVNRDTMSDKILVAMISDLIF